MKKCTLAIVALAICILMGCSSSPEAVEPAAQSRPLVVFLVRHAEKAGLARDPELSDVGCERAAALARTLHDAGIDYVHSSDYRRTRETAGSVAAEFDLQVRLYDPRNLGALAEELRRMGGRHLVVGHSNTTPKMVELLGGDPGSKIDESSEFDRLYIVEIAPNGTVASTMLRYGRPYLPGQVQILQREN